MNKWNNRFIELCNHISSWSKDASTKVGAVIVDSDKRILSIGYNGFPAGVDDDVETRHERPIKYMFTEHAERNAIFTASRIGVSLVDSTLYCNYFPCPDCARAIIQSGIKNVIYQKMFVNSNNQEAKDNLQWSVEMLKEAGVHFECVKPEKLKTINTANFKQYR
jgi:dCMP deaminase